MVKTVNNRIKRNITLHFLVIPGIVLSLIFVYIPLLGSVMAFQNYNPFKGFADSPWVGFDNFRFIANLYGTFEVLRNTIYIAILKIIGRVIVPVLFSLLLNEINNVRAKRVYQTLIYLPNFLSWVLLSGIFIDILSPSEGIVNQFLEIFSIGPIFFLGDKFWFPVTMVITDIWKTFGFSTIIYLAALTTINPELYESSVIDGANRWQQTIHITIPGIINIVILMTVLGLGNILNAGFDQIFNMLNPSVYETGDVIDTFIYRLGIEQQQYSASAAVGLFKSIVSFLFVSLSYYLADRLANYRIF